MKSYGDFVPKSSGKIAKNTPDKNPKAAAGNLNPPGDRRSGTRARAPAVAAVAVPAVAPAPAETPVVPAEVPEGKTLGDYIMDAERGPAGRDNVSQIVAMLSETPEFQKALYEGGGGGGKTGGSSRSGQGYALSPEMMEMRPNMSPGGPMPRAGGK
jgi:hypothetical protein